MGVTLCGVSRGSPKTGPYHLRLPVGLLPSLGFHLCASVRGGWTFCNPPTPHPALGAGQVLLPLPSPVSSSVTTVPTSQVILRSKQHSIYKVLRIPSSQLAL